MDVAGITFPSGTALTTTTLDAAFATLTAHQIVRPDFASGFAWGQDLDLDGFGLLNARHINSRVVDATQFRAGNNAGAIQAAIDFVNDGAGKGTVVIPALSGAWTMDAPVSTYSGINIVGVGWPQLNKTHTSDLFIASGTDANGITVTGLHVTANGNAGSFLHLLNGCQNIHVIRNLVEGLEGYMVFADADASGSSWENVFIQNNSCVAALLKTRDNVSIGSIGQFMITHNIVNLDGGATAPGAYVIQANDSAGPGWHISDNTVDGGTVAGFLYLTAGSGAMIANNVFEGGKAGSNAVEIESSSRVRFLNNQVHIASVGVAAMTAAVSVTNSDQVYIANNRIGCPANNTQVSTLYCNYGIQLDSNCDSCTITDNFLEDMGTVAGGSRAQTLGVVLAPININSATNLDRHGNRLTEDMYVSWTISNDDTASVGPTKEDEEACAGVRAAGTDAARNALIQLRSTVVYPGATTNTLARVLGVGVDTDDTLFVVHPAPGGAPTAPDIHIWVEG
ncbi:MAG: hypothetical protein GY838_13675 [bacterium]|nr:hypothetical protein [bacterium]